MSLQLFTLGFLGEKVPDPPKPKGKHSTLKSQTLNTLGRMVISKSLRSKSKVAPTTPLSPSTAKLKISDKSRRPKKIREDEHKQGAAEQDNQCAVAALAHFNQGAASKLGVTYELVKAGLSAAFMPGLLQPGFFFHCNFTAKPAECADGCQPVLFFAELYEPYGDPPRVTLCCVLGPADQVCLGYNGCRACGPGCPVIHHPVGGFYPGVGFCPLSPSP